MQWAIPLTWKTHTDSVGIQVVETQHHQFQVPESLPGPPGSSPHLHLCPWFPMLSYVTVSHVAPSNVLVAGSPIWHCSWVRNCELWHLQPFWWQSFLSSLASVLISRSEYNQEQTLLWYSKDASYDTMEAQQCLPLCMALKTLQISLDFWLEYISHYSEIIF